MKLQELVPTSLQSKYGKVFMGSKKSIAKLQNSEKEPDTELEEKLADYLWQWVDRSSHELADNLYRFKRDIEKLAKANPWLKYNKSKVYRVTGTTDKELINAFIEAYKKNPSKGSYILPINYMPHIKVQSWTSSLKFAEVFTSAYDDQTGAGFLEIILVDTDIQDFYFPDKILYLIADITDPETRVEKEVIRFSDQPKKMKAICLSRSVKNYIKEYHIDDTISIDNNTSSDTELKNFVANDLQSHDKLKLLKNVKIINGNLEIQNSNLTDLNFLNGLQVKGQIDLSNNELKSLKGCPDTKTIYVNHNNLRNLEGCPESAKYIDCGYNELISLEGAPDSVRVFNCSRNKLTSLEGGPKTVEETLILTPIL
jgi:hypothetical protein